MLRFSRHHDPAPQRFMQASKNLVLSRGSLVGAQTISYKNPEAVRAASGLRNPNSPVDAGRFSIRDPLTIWPGACDVCPGASVLKVIGPCVSTVSNPRLGVMVYRSRGRTADQAAGCYEHETNCRSRA